MARQGITPDQVHTAATALSEEGVSPTVQAVRERIGSGSYTTISAHLTGWRSEHAGQVPANIPDMPEKVGAAFHQVWSVAARAAQEDVETQRQALEAMRREMEKEKADMGAEIERLERGLDAADQRGVQLAQDLGKEQRAGAEKGERVTALTVENARLDERVKAAEARGEEFRTQVESLQGKLADMARVVEAKKPAPTPRRTRSPAKKKAGALPEGKA